jgi:hypothetical protein
MKKVLFFTIVLTGVAAMYTAQKLYAIQQATPEQAAQIRAQQMQQAQEMQQQMTQMMEANDHVMTFVNTMYVGFTLKIKLKGNNNCNSQDYFINPGTTSGASTLKFGFDKSCCMTSFELDYVPTSCNSAYGSSCKAQNWYSKSGLNNGNGICKDTTFTIKEDDSAEYSTRVDW